MKIKYYLDFLILNYVRRFPQLFLIIPPKDAISAVRSLEIWRLWDNPFNSPLISFFRHQWQVFKCKYSTLGRRFTVIRCWGHYWRLCVMTRDIKWDKTPNGSAAWYDLNPWMNARRFVWWCSLFETGICNVSWWNTLNWGRNIMNLWKFVVILWLFSCGMFCNRRKERGADVFVCIGKIWKSCSKIIVFYILTTDINSNCVWWKV